MKLSDLVRLSDFEHYHFIVDSDEIKRANIHTLTASYSTKTGTYELTFDFDNSIINSNGLDFHYYDLGRCTQGTSLKNAQTLGAWIDKTKAFKILKLEHTNDTLYVHLKLK